MGSYNQRKYGESEALESSRDLVWEQMRVRMIANGLKNVLAMVTKPEQTVTKQRGAMGTNPWQR